MQQGDSIFKEESYEEKTSKCIALHSNGSKCVRRMSRLSSDKKDSSEKAKVSSDGKVLNIYCWNDEFRSRMISHYPGYKKVNAKTGKIGNVTVKWNETPSKDNAYQNNLDAALKKQDSASADNKIDLLPGRSRLCFEVCRFRLYTSCY